VFARVVGIRLTKLVQTTYYITNHLIMLLSTFCIITAHRQLIIEIEVYDTFKIIFSYILIVYRLTRIFIYYNISFFIFTLF